MTDESTSYCMQWLPTELLINIVNEIPDDDDLLALAATSHQFHSLSLDRYFRKHDFDPLSRELNLNSNDDCINLLKGLSVSLDLVGSSIDRLVYDCGYTKIGVQLAKEVRLLTRYVSRLSSLNRATLRIATHFGSQYNDWEILNIALLDTILARSCRDVHVTTLQLHNVGSQPRDMPPSSKPPDWLKDYWPINHPLPRITPNNLQSCLAGTFPRFLRPFYYHTFNTNRNSITSLAFQNVFGGGVDWTTMLANLHFPNLRKLAIIYGVIARDPFIKFLARHLGTLTAFEYHHIRYHPRPKMPMRTTLLVPVFQTSLEELTTSPEHIMSFFPSFSTFSRLRSVEIKIEELMTGNTTFAALEGNLRMLAACTTHIALTLAVTRAGLGFGVWFANMFSPPDGRPFKAGARPERNLHCVETLVMNNGDWGFADNALVAHLARWVALFPQLRMLNLIAGKYAPKFMVTGEDQSLETVLVGVIKEACPDIHVEYGEADPSA